MGFKVKSDGIDIAVEQFGHGPPLVFAHGLTGNRHFSRQQLTPLADRFTIIVYDQRGHCDSSPVTDPALYDRGRMAEDMTAVLDALNINKAVVGGESMGAATTLTFALHHPDRVEKLLLTAPAFGDTTNNAADGIKQMGQAIAEKGLPAFLADSAIRQREELGWPEPVIQSVAAMQSTHQAQSLAVACQTVIEWRLDMSLLPAITCPTCIIAWDNDPLHPLALAQRYLAAIPHAQLKTIPSLTQFFLKPSLIGQIYGRFLTGIS